MRRWRYQLAPRIRALLRRRQVEAELDEELRFHLGHLIAANTARGLGPREARRAALRELGAGDWIEEECRDARGLRWLESLVQDVRYAVRQMRRHPAFSATVITILALGIGANTAIFSVFNAVLLRPLPYPHPQQLMRLYATSPHGHGRWPMDYPDFVDWQKQNRTFADMALFWGGSVTNLSSHSGATQVQGRSVSAGFFRVFGVRPILGRSFTTDDTRPGHTHEAVLSYALWVRQFGDDPGIVGRAVQFDEQPYTVIGVMPRGFAFPGTTQVWTPLTMTASARGAREDHNYVAVGRLKPGVTLAEARADLNTVAARLAKKYPQADGGFGAVVVPLHSDITGGSRQPLTLTLWAAGLLWLLACVDVASMLLARAVARQPEMAIRAALGGSRMRLARQLLTETVLLAFTGGIVGLAVAWGGIRWLTSLHRTGLAAPNPIRLDLTVLAFAFGLAALTGALFGLVLAWRSPAAGAGSRSTMGRRRARLNRGLVIGEIAISVVLLAAAGLLLGSLYHLIHAPIGVNPTDVLTAHIVLPESRYGPDNDPRQFQFTLNFLHRIEALPGVREAALANALPLSDTGYGYIAPRGRPYRGNQSLMAGGMAVTPGYFRLFGIPILRGRTFDTNDIAHMTRLAAEYYQDQGHWRASLGTVDLPALINQTLARYLWPGENPVGKEFWFGPPGPWYRVVGVAADVANQSLGEPVRPAEYTPFVGEGSFYIVIRSAHPMALAPSVRKTLAAFDPDLALFDVAAMSQIIARDAGGTRFLSLLLTLFAGLALALATGGIYGVLSYAVAQRRREMGIRLSLGAQPHQLLHQTFGDGIRLAGFGVIIGIAGALAEGHLLANSLYKVRPDDPAILAAAALVISIAAACACFWPARRAARVDPVEALRDD